MIFTNSKGYEYHIRLVGQEGDDPLTLDNIRIDHQDRPEHDSGGILCIRGR